MRTVTLLVAILGVSVVGACKGDPVKCEAACRNYAKLNYWDVANKDIAAAPADKREALNKKYLAKFGGEVDEGVDVCVSQCSSANNEKTIDCMIAAQNVTDVRKCGGEPDEKK
ncbi:MAG TPA: hypothetical protein VGM90_03830 [Kofleriaceae bacterium]|jgi:hypothetical protein